MFLISVHILLHHPCGIPAVVPTFVAIICVYSLCLCLHKGTIV